MQSQQGILRERAASIQGGRTRTAIINQLIVLKNTQASASQRAFLYEALQHSIYIIPLFPQYILLRLLCMTLFQLLDILRIFLIQ